LGNIFIPSQSQIHPLAGEPIPGFLGAIGEYFSIFGDDVPFYPGPGNVGLKGDFIFTFTCLDAEATADALVGIHQKNPTDRPRSSMKRNRPEGLVQALSQGQGGGPSQS
jgi:hypothetical protein